MMEYNTPLLALHPFSMSAYTGVIARIAVVLKLVKWKR